MAITRTLARTLIFAGIAAVLVPGLSSADTRNQGYLVTSDSSIVTSGTGLCWHTSDWTPERAVAPCDRVVVAEAPRLADATPAPAPERVMPHEINLSADALFDFNKSVLRPQGKARLDELAHELDGTQYETVTVTGHTDRIGSAAYNQKLSLRRADAVQEYLVGRGGIHAHRISTHGMGETQPVTHAGDCKGPKSHKLITCLQPDRRVEVAVTGTKE